LPPPPPRRPAPRGRFLGRDDLDLIACPECGADGDDLEWEDTDWRGQPRADIVHCLDCDARFRFRDGDRRSRSLLQRLLTR
jgi:hypothetical protein